MTRKQWINSISDEEALKIHRTFRQVDKGLFALPIMPTKEQIKNAKYPNKFDSVDFAQKRRTAVRSFLRKNKLTQRDLKVQYGRLAAGLSISPFLKS